MKQTLRIRFEVEGQPDEAREYSETLADINLDDAVRIYETALRAQFGTDLYLFPTRSGDDVERDEVIRTCERDALRIRENARVLVNRLWAIAGRLSRELEQVTLTEIGTVLSEREPR